MATTGNRLLDIYDNYDEEPGLDHWRGYAIHYNHHFKRWIDSKDHVKMLEIGVQSGGSTRVWSQFFGDQLDYIGVDINPNCAQFEDPSRRIHIVIGSQLNTTFLDEICKIYGPFDIIIDDGGHTTEMMVISFENLFTCLKDKGVYAIEDLHTMKLFPYSPGMVYKEKNIYGHLAGYQERMIGYWTKQGMGPNGHWPVYKRDPFITHLHSMTTYDSIVFFKYQEKWQPEKNIKKGKRFIPYR